MKIREISEAGFGAKALYALTGLGKDAAYAATKQDAATRDRAAANQNFLATIRDEVKGLITSSNQAGIPVDLTQYVKTYAQKNRLGAFTPAQEAALTKIAADATAQKYSTASIDKLANFLHAVGLQHGITPYQQNNKNKQNKQNKQNPANTGIAPAAGVTPAPELTSSTEQILKTIKTLNQEDNADDLRAIALAALGILYKLDTAKYAELRQAITTGKTPAGTKAGLLPAQQAAQTKVDQQAKIDSAFSARAGT